MITPNKIFKPGLFVISAPSGTGKTSIIKACQKVCPALRLSVSYTTRSPRDGEVDGQDYCFVSKTEFQRKIERNDFIEWAEVYGNYYGTCREYIREHQALGEIIVLDIDVQGAMQLQEKKLQANYLFIAPPSLENLRERLEGRGSESVETLERRLSNARHELSFQDRYDHVIINDDLPRASREFIETIIPGCLSLELLTAENMDLAVSEVLAVFGGFFNNDRDACESFLTNILTKSKR